MRIMVQPMHQGCASEKKKEEERRAALIAARTETKSISKLKEKRLSEYKKLESKLEEQDIEEFISRRESLAH